MKTILVSGASGIVGYGILRSLKKSDLALKLIGTTIYKDSIAPYFSDVVEIAPRTGDSGYVTWLLETIEKNKVDLIIPGIEIDVFKWVEHISEIEKAGAAALLNNSELIELCKDKWAFYESLRATGLPCAIESSLVRDFDYFRANYKLPFLLKPRRGFGSKGIVKIDNYETFLQHQSDIGPVLIVQPIVGTDDEEFTTSAFGDGSGGFYASMTLRRKLSKEGFTEQAEVVQNEEFADIVLELCKRYQPIGPTNFQFRKCTDGLKLLEINPRISSSTSIRTAFGYNENAMSIEFYLENRMPVQPKIKRGRAVRYTDEHIIYEESVHF